MITDQVETDLISGSNVSGVNPTNLRVLPGLGIPLVIQDKTFVDANTVFAQDPTWNWGTGTRDANGNLGGATPAVTGDLWYPHVYMVVSNPYDVTGVDPFGKWFYGPWFNPPTPVCVNGQPAGCIEVGLVPNEYAGTAPWEAPLRPGTPNPSIPGESFMDTPLVNGTAYPYVEVPAGPVRFRVLNANKDRFFSHTYETDLSKYPDLPQGGTQLYEFNTYINNPIVIDLWGIEGEWQTHLWYLPEPFSGIVFNINYTHIFSEASYPRTNVYTDYDEEGNIVQTVVDTFYTTRMLNQPNDVANVALGYDLGGFSLRLSLLYQDNIFKRPDFWLQQRVLSDKFTRWDLSFKQNLPWFGMQVYFNVNIITGEDDVDVNAKNLYEASTQRYGMSADTGFVLRF